ncbi:MAG TPA: hypothetical protein VFZ66_17615 [Herpetosiphonaceae bacterium]
MPIVAGNDPKPAKESKGSGCGWLIFLLVFFWRPLYNMIRSVVNGRISDQQLLIIVGGVVALVVLALIVQRVNRSRQGSAASLPPSYTPPSTLAKSYRQLQVPSEPFMPSAPRFEPIITGKVVLAGIMLFWIFGGIGLLLMWLS